MREQGGRRLNVSGVLRHLGVSRSGYNTWKNRIPSNQEQRKNKIKDKICDIYDESHQNSGAPKITKKLKEEGETISEKTVGNYMREMGLKAQWIKPYTITYKVRFWMYLFYSHPKVSARICRILRYPLTPKNFRV